ncbi:MAG: cytochrome c oxidase assembly protein [Caulobacterales bacterium]|jgi:cytochrome c oxidase assembly protein subunit 11
MNPYGHNGLDRAKQRRMAVSAAACVALVAGMVGLSFAAVPLYRLFCQVTGYGGTTQVAQAAPTAVLARTMEVRFDTNVAVGLPLELNGPATPSVVRLGETALVYFTMHNPSDRPVTTVASYNVTPHKTGIYFHKMQCFCFQEQVIQPGETKEFPVIFYVAPELADDINVEEVRTVTLSYTMHRSMDDAAEDALDTAAAPRALAGDAG